MSRQVQQTRKAEDLHVTARIALPITAPAATLDAVRSHQGLVADAVLATSVSLVPSSDDATRVDLTVA